MFAGLGSRACLSVSLKTFEELSQKEIKKWEADYNISATKLMKNVELLKSEINYLTIKDKDLYMNKLLNKFYGNDEKNLNAEEKELIGKLVK